jgi:hypothetical protein
MHDPSPIRKVGLISYASAITAFPLFNYYWNHPYKGDNGVYLSGGIDPKMAITEGLDMRLGMFCHYNRIEPSIIYESFPAMKYNAVSFGAGYMQIKRKVSLIVGGEYSRICNRNPNNLHIVNSFGANAEIRVYTNTRFSLSYLANIKTRPEISKGYVFSSYINLNFKIY